MLQGDYGKTPIFYALLLGNTDMVHALFDRGARVDITLRGENEVTTKEKIIGGEKKIINVEKIK